MLPSLLSSCHLQSLQSSMNKQILFLIQKRKVKLRTEDSNPGEKALGGSQRLRMQTTHVADPVCGPAVTSASFLRKCELWKEEVSS